MKTRKVCYFCLGEGKTVDAEKTIGTQGSRYKFHINCCLNHETNASNKIKEVVTLLK
jgi:hypothetical protein